MSGLISLLQDEVRMLVAEMQESVRLAATPATSSAALARWSRRGQALVGAISVLGRETWSRLAQGLHQLGTAQNTDALLTSAVAESLQLFEGFAQAAEHAAEALLEQHAAQADALCLRLVKAEAEPASEDPDTTALMPLFRQEAEDQCASMGQFLLQLEQQPERLDLIMPVMRAAHAIKGASRVVRLDAAVQLAHALEDQLVAAQALGTAVSEETIEFCLANVDLLREIAQHGATPALLKRQTALLSSRLKAAAEQPAVARTESLPPAYAATEEADPVLRIKASLVGRLIALAGSGVVGAHRLRPFAQRQQRLRRDVGNLGRLIDDLYHRLGAPSATTALGAQLAELRRGISATRHQTQGWIDDFAEYSREAFDLHERIYQAASMTRLRPFRDLVIGYPRMLRDLARQLGKRVRLTVVGEALEVDRDVLEKLDAPLTHLLRNAVDHGLELPELRQAANKSEEGRVRIWATHRAGMLAIEVSDDGAGIRIESVRRRLVEQGRMSAEAAALQSDHALCDQLFAPGFSTAKEVTEISGRGVGLDVVREGVERLGGSIRLSTELGKGSTFHIQVPISRAVTRALAVQVAGEIYAFPSLRIERVVRSERSLIVPSEGLQYLPLAGRNIGLIPLAETLDLPSVRVQQERLDLVVVAHQGRLTGFVVDQFLGEYDLATRPLDPRLGRVTDIGAVALLPDGEPVVLLDIDELMRSVARSARKPLLARNLEAPRGQRRKRVLVVDDSISVRELERQLLLGRGFEVEVAVDGMDAWTRVREEPFDLLITDVDMPRMDGIELTRSIKQEPRLRAMPVVIVSYRDRPEDRRRGLEARADRYLTKADFHGENFLKAVHELVGDAQEGA